RGVSTGRCGELVPAPGLGGPLHPRRIAGLSGRRQLGRLTRPTRAAHVMAYANGQEAAMSEPRTVSLFRNGRNQAVRIPVEFELPGDEALMRKEGDRLVIEPARKRGLVSLLKSMKPLE